MKYATLTLAEYRRFMDADLVKAKHYNEQMQLISGFFKLRDDVVDGELRTAARRLGLALEDLTFSRRVEAATDAAANDHVWESLVGTRGRTFENVFKAFCDLATRAVPYAFVLGASTAFGAAIAAMPLVLRVVDGHPPLGRGTLATTCCLTSMVLTFLAAIFVCLFLATIVGPTGSRERRARERGARERRARDPRPVR